jgi:adenine-specific DNA-methyltransferase
MSPHPSTDHEAASPEAASDTPAGALLPATEVIEGDCVAAMHDMADGSVDFILADPPYLARYRDCRGRTLAGDTRTDWVQPAYAEMYRVLKPDALCVTFYGWAKVHLFVEAWRTAGFRIVGHLVFRKDYTSSERFLRYQHEAAYLLAKGDVVPPGRPLPDVLDWPENTGNRLHPTQKPVGVLTPLIESFCPEGGVVLDPFCGSGSTLVAASQTGRRSIGIEIDPAHVRTARKRMEVL